MQPEQRDGLVSLGELATRNAEQAAGPVRSDMRHATCACPKGTEISLTFQPDGRVFIRSWHAGRIDAAYPLMTTDKAMSTALPQLCREIAEFLQAGRPPILKGARDAA